MGCTGSIPIVNETKAEEHENLSLENNKLLSLKA